MAMRQATFAPAPQLIWMLMSLVWVRYAPTRMLLELGHANKHGRELLTRAAGVSSTTSSSSGAVAADPSSPCAPSSMSRKVPPKLAKISPSGCVERTACFGYFDRGPPSSCTDASKSSTSVVVGAGELEDGHRNAVVLSIRGVPTEQPLAGVPGRSTFTDGIVGGQGSSAGTTFSNLRSVSRSVNRRGLCHSRTDDEDARI